MGGRNYTATKSRHSCAINTVPSRFAVAFLLISLSQVLSAASIPLQQITRWAIQAGSSPLPAPFPQLWVFDADLPQPSEASGVPIRVAYLSVGEAEDRRPYWAKEQDAPYLAELDKDSEGGTRVDFRNPQWQDVLLHEEIPRLLKEGVQGLMLAKLDSIPFLEAKNPERYAGSTEALKSWLAELRHAYPSLILLAEGPEALEDAAPYVDGYVVEGVFTEWDPASRRVRRRTREKRDEILDEVENAAAIAARPVFTVEYADSPQDHPAREAVKESLKRGFRPFIKIR